MGTRITRRQLGATAISVAAFAQAPSSYRGALDGLEAKVASNTFDPVEWTRMRHDSMPLSMTFKASTRSAATAWQKKLKTKIAELVGDFPAKKTPLDAQTLAVTEFPTYRREKFIITSREGVGVLGYVITPKNRKPPFAPMICLPGHGRGVDDIVGIDDKGKERTTREGYEFDFALQAVEHGFAAIALEQMAFGCRRGKQASRGSLTASSCQPTAGAALLFGETMVGWRVWDVIRTMDWIETRPELDASRIGVAGISGGGTISLFSAALDNRVQLAYVSGYLNTFKDSILSLSHCIDNYVPGILKYAEMYDVAGLIAPRPLFVESGSLDNIFPIAASRESVQRVRKVYSVFSAPDKIEHEVFEGPHEFHGKQGWEFAKRHLKPLA